MKISYHKRRLVSYIYDVPIKTCRELQKPENNTNISQKVIAAMKNYTNRIEQSNRFSTSNDTNSTNPDQTISQHKLKFCLNFLPYIHAQNGPQKTKDIITSLENCQSNDSLPLIRKRHDLNIFDTKLQANISHSRNRTVEIAKYNNF